MGIDWGRWICWLYGYAKCRYHVVDGRENKKEAWKSGMREWNDCLLEEVNNLAPHTHTHTNTHASQRETHDVNTSTIFNLNYGSQALNMYHSRRCRSACEHAQHAHVATQGARLFGALCPDPGVFLLMSVRAWLEHWCCRFFARVWTSEIRDLSIS